MYVTDTLYYSSQQTNKSKISKVRINQVFSYPKIIWDFIKKFQRLHIKNFMQQKIIYSNQQNFALDLKKKNRSH